MSKVVACICIFTEKIICNPLAFKVFLYQRVDMLYVGYCLHPEVNSLVVQTLGIPRCGDFVLVNTEQVIGYRHRELVDAEWITAAGYSGQS